MLRLLMSMRPLSMYAQTTHKKNSYLVWCLQSLHEFFSSSPCCIGTSMMLRYSFFRLTNNQDKLNFRSTLKMCVSADARQFIRHRWRQIISRVWLARRRLTDICYSSSSSILQQQQQQQQQLQLRCEADDPHHSTDPFPSPPGGEGRRGVVLVRTLIDKYTQTRTEIVIYIRYVAV